MEGLRKMFVNNKWGLLLIVLVTLTFRLLPEIGMQFYDEGTDSYYRVAIEGLFTSEAEHLPAAWGKWTFISVLQQQLYQLFPAVSWYSVSLLLTSVWTVMLFVSIARLVWTESRSNTGAWIQASLLGLFGLLYLENIVLIQFTRMAHFLCLFGLVYVILSIRNNKKLSWFVLLNGTAAFVVGAMIRLEPALLSLGLLIPLLIYMYFSKQISLKRVAPTLVAPFIICLVISTLINTATTESDKLTVMHNKFLHNTDGVKYGNDELNIQTKSDSLAYNITHSYFLNDPEYINEEFVNRIGLRAFLSPTTLTDHITDGAKLVSKLQTVGWPYLKEHSGLSLLFLLISLVAVLSANSLILRLSSLLVVLIFAGYYVIISGYMKMDHHVFVPLFFSFGFLLTLIIETRINGKFLGVLALVLAVLVSKHEASYLVDQLKYKRIETALIEDYMAKAKGLNSEYNVFGLRSIFRFYTRPFQKNPFSRKDNLVSFEPGLIFVLPTYEQRLINVMGSKDLTECWELLAKHSESTTFMVKYERLETILDYFNQQHGTNLSAVIIDPSWKNVYDNKLQASHGLGLFKVVSE